MSERPATGIPRVGQAGPNLPVVGGQPNAVSDVKFPGYWGAEYVVQSIVINGGQIVSMTFLDQAGSESATPITLPANVVLPAFRTVGCQGIRFRSASAAAIVSVLMTPYVFDTPADETPASVTDMQLITTYGEAKK